MRLLTVGDSFTYGEELHDRNNAWPYLLEQNTGWTVNNLGAPAKGNTSMVRTVVSEVDNYDIVVIAWSHFARIEVADEMGVFDIWPGCNEAQFNHYGQHRKQLIKYVTKHFSDEYLLTQYLINVVTLQRFLESNNKKYLMLDAFGNNVPWRTTTNEALVKQIDTRYYLGWPDETMMEWTYNVPLGARGHFLDEGHAIVAQKIYEHIRN